MAHIILQSPHASAGEKAFAGLYAGTFYASHAAAGIGGTILAGANPAVALKGALWGGGYAAAQHGLAESGVCGCEAQQAAQGRGFWKSVGQGGFMGLLGGGTFGQAYTMGPWGKIGVGTAGASLSGYGLYASGHDMIKQGLNPCNLLNAGMSTIGLVGSSQIIRQGIVEIQQSRIMYRQDSYTGSVDPDQSIQSLSPTGIERGDSRILEQNLEVQGIQRPPDSAAHHLVAANDPRAAPARAVLAREGIGINEANNGAFLPRNQNVPNPSGATVHSTLHTNLYYSTVNGMLISAAPGTVRDVLSLIAQELLAGTLTH